MHGALEARTRSSIATKTGKPRAHVPDVPTHHLQSTLKHGHPKAYCAEGQGQLLSEGVCPSVHGQIQRALDEAAFGQVFQRKVAVPNESPGSHVQGESEMISMLKK